MKALLIALLLSVIGHAGDDSPRHVRVSVQFIEVSHMVVSEMLEGEAGGAEIHKKIMDLSMRGEAKILDTNMIVGRSRDRAVIISGIEEIYPVEYEPPGFGQINFKSFFPPDRAFAAFEVKETGMHLEIEPTIYAGERFLDLRIHNKFVRRARLETWMEHKDEWGEASFRMPTYEGWVTDTTLVLESGKSELVCVFTPEQQSPAPALARRVLLFVRADVVEVR